MAVLATVSVAALAVPTSGGARGTVKRVHAAKARSAQADVLRGRGMWIWFVSASNGGSLSSIISTAHRYGVSTLFIKAGDGGSVWGQFNRGLVNTLHANRLHACAWQYVYGNNPVGEAQVGAAAVRNGADCLAIDAESEYEGKYISAQTYLGTLRHAIGSRFPLTLASFPYVDYHPGFPYSVFLGPGGAQYNTPQMYWVAIGTSVDGVYTHTYTYNRVYGRPIDPLGQVYSNPPASQIIRFRMESRPYGARGVSWWDWQEATPTGWYAVSRPAGAIPGFTPSSALAVLRKGATGDLVVLAQERLVSAGYRIAVDGGFGPKTAAAVIAFQRAHRLGADAVIGPQTWSVLERYAPVSVTWTNGGALVRAAGARGGLIRPVPKSASLRAKRDEIPGSLGSGGSPR